MSSNWLKINPDKTEVLHIAPKECPWSERFWPIELGAPLTPVPTVKSLEIKVDSGLSMGQQVSAVCGVYTGLLRRLRKLAPLLTSNTLYTVETALILSRLDYGNVLYIGLQGGMLDRLQVVMNNAAQLLFKLACDGRMRSPC